jgi:hypothetical protein
VLAWQQEELRKRIYMKKLIIVLSLIISSAAFAISDVNLIKKCAEKGASKIIEQAKSLQCNVVMNSFSVTDIDNRFYNPSKYVWYAAQVNCENENSSIQKMVQYNSISGECL